MAYYIISSDPDLMGQFQARHDVLKAAVWIKDKAQLNQLAPTMGESSYVLVHFNKGPRDQLDDLVLTLRDVAIGAKLIYVTENLAQEKTSTHKMTPVGGDAYISFDVNIGEFKRIIEQLKPKNIAPHANRLENQDSNTIQISAGLDKMRAHENTVEINTLFAQFNKQKKGPPKWQSTTSFAASQSGDNTLAELDLGADMSDKDQDLPLDDLGDLEISEESTADTQTVVEDSGLELSLDGGEELDLAGTGVTENVTVAESGMDLPVVEDELKISDEGTDAMSLEATKVGQKVEAEVDELGDLGSLDDLGDLGDLDGDLESFDEALNLGPNDETMAAKKSDLGLKDDDLDSLDFGGVVETDNAEMSDDAKKKLKEIDAIMDLDASQASLNVGMNIDLDAVAEQPISGGSDLDQPLVSDDLDLDTLNFGDEIEPVVEEKTKKRKGPAKPVVEASDDEEDAPTRVVKIQKPSAPVKDEETRVVSRNLGADLKEISGAYSGELERTQATIANLRADREELLAKIQRMEEDKIVQSRQNLTLRAELDEKKIELSIIRKKLNDEITELKDRMKLHDEKRLILEEKNRVLSNELDKTAQKNKIDVKKVQLREKELEQKLELLKSDAETQIRNRDHKILELKRKLDSMEFDMESISQQEKRSVESRFELEDKLDKAIKTLRSAITVLENESEKSGVLEALKKNIDM